MRLVTKKANIRCGHQLGKVELKASQNFVRIDDTPILVRQDTQGCKIDGCPPIPPLKPCLVTLSEITGHSDFIRISGRPVTLDLLKGLTSGDPPATVPYTVHHPGQTFVRQK
ncbi:hypothetical protein [Parasulfitobacter algicola]|uniref:Uncharacterized protein n=1 Tax=Parasulfitobacter algicola TaxID=2614809 RepID=A0ABX2IS91_9RHOB|nr:hypothetical protein [Sulfitobacter algicola]NSX55756.1 hypothetical protein [Sulfitobacter algicola]